MTIQQLSRFLTALKCLFDQATGEPSPVASNVLLLPAIPGLARCRSPQ
jgi:hypothetical protein